MKNTCKYCGKIITKITNSSYCNKCRHINKTCPVCGKKFITNRIHDTKTCSIVCSLKIRWANVDTERANRRPPCTNCGAPITRKYIGYGKNKANHLFCNTKCMGEWQAKNRVGENHPRWKGGDIEYYGGNWRTQRAAARKRDKVCRRCGKTPKENGKALDVHHIKPFRDFGVDNYKEANQLSNLISYCSSCHQLVEWGRINQ